jgi:hypothetical protein
VISRMSVRLPPAASASAARTHTGDAWNAKMPSSSMPWLASAAARTPRQACPLWDRRRGPRRPPRSSGATRRPPSCGIGSCGGCAPAGPPRRSRGAGRRTAPTANAPCARAARGCTRRAAPSPPQYRSAQRPAVCGMRRRGHANTRQSRR